MVRRNVLCNSLCDARMLTALRDALRRMLYATPMPGCRYAMGYAMCYALCSMLCAMPVFQPRTRRSRSRRGGGGRRRCRA